MSRTNVPVILSHRTVNGEVPTADITGDTAKTRIASGLYNPQQARVLLGLLLAEGKEFDEIRNVFGEATFA